jgi:hypothetical protein
MYVERRKKFFQREGAGFLFVFHGLLGLLDGVWGSVFAVLACASMLFSVKFNVGMREVRDVAGALREGKFRKKKAIIA